jgi:hypothetical protein
MGININIDKYLKIPDFKFPGMPDLSILKTIYDTLKPLFTFRTLLVVPIIFLYLFVIGIIYYSFESVIVLLIILLAIFKLL